MNGLDLFAFFLTEAWNLLNYPFELYGYQLSFFQVFAYTTVGGILLWMVWEVFNG